MTAKPQTSTTNNNDHPLSSPKYIVIHCSATTPDMDVDSITIDQWHRANGWTSIGYHFVIRRSGLIEPGRPLDQSHLPGWQIARGAHVFGFNDQSIGICMVGGLSFNRNKVANPHPLPLYTDDQWDSLLLLCRTLRRIFPLATFIGHRDLDPGKECPSFDVKSWASSNGLGR